MRRWNGWGDETNSLDLPPNADMFLKDKIGTATPLPSVSLESVMSQVPVSRLPEHPLIVVAEEDRVRHARGQSLPDLLASRSGDFGVFPDGVAYPETSDQVAELLSFCGDKDILVIPYGGGTSVVGHINPFQSEKPILTIDMGRMNRLMDLDKDSLIATFGAGTPGPQVESQLHAKGYTLGHFPQSFELATLGGWVASRSSGQQSLRYGRIEQLFAGGRVETPKGRMDIPTFPASSGGPDVREMMLGSEGRMGIISEVKVRVSKLADQENFYVIFFPEWSKAKDAAKALVQSRIQLSMLRLSNAIETETQLALAGHEMQIALMEKALSFRGADSGKCMMTLGLTGSKAQCNAALSQLKKIIKSFSGIYTGTMLGKRWEEKRFTMPYLREALWDKGYAVDTLETATNWENVDNLLNKMEESLRTALNDENEKVHVFTHLSHFYGQGCSIYTTYVYRTADTHQKTLDWWAKLKHSTSAVIVNNGGTISHQHGVGKDHAPFLPVEKGKLGIMAIRSLCDAFDPEKRMNPGTLLVDTNDE
ncbi:FAD-binding oxidoreductase [Alkalimarinus alittae]|uniref:FAD-binding oxidoreductase n=1 Tax=Alkalimarinus alittae TaxID=2961619 RepID=A0ABY6N5M4_9ALTE|nr:FAD-binding oxidoreductase [Alkalimarinus alittae]UZE97418.1 FAD-binding oxidoreductase [Alkalimarinus alittae]